MHWWHLMPLLMLPFVLLAGLYWCLRPSHDMTPKSPPTDPLGLIAYRSPYSYSVVEQVFQITRSINDTRIIVEASAGLGLDPVGLVEATQEAAERLKNIRDFADGQ